MNTIQTLLLLLFSVLPKAFSDVRLTDNPNAVVKREVKERTCPACINGNVTGNSSIWMGPLPYQEELVKDYKDCEVNPMWVTCSEACLTIIAHRETDTEHYEYDGLVMGCSDGIEIENLSHVNDWKVQGRIYRKKRIQINYIWHMIQYESDEIFDHIRIFNYPHNWPNGTTTPISPNSHQTLSPKPICVIATVALFSLLLTIFAFSFQLNVIWKPFQNKGNTGKPDVNATENQNVNIENKDEDVIRKVTNGTNRATTNNSATQQSRHEDNPNTGRIYLQKLV